MMGIIGFIVGFVGFLMHQLIDVISEYVSPSILYVSFITISFFTKKKATTTAFHPIAKMQGYLDWKI